MAFGSIDTRGGRQPETSTYIRWRTRILNHWQKDFEEKQAQSKKINAEYQKKIREGKIDPRSNFEKIVDRVKKEHPGEFKNLLQARTYARKKDPIGRRYERLRKQGLADVQIGNRLHIGRMEKASTGRSGN